MSNDILKAEQINPLVVAPLPQVYDIQSLIASHRDVRFEIQGAMESAPSIPDLNFGAQIGSEDITVIGMLRGPSEALPENWWGERPAIPSLNLSVLHQAIVFGGWVGNRTAGRHENGQLLLNREGHLHPQAFSTMDGQYTLPADLVAGEQSMEPFEFIGDHELTPLSGSYLFLGSIHRHFGHVLLEGLARAWAQMLPQIVALDLRFLIYEHRILDWAYELLALAGIPADRLVFAPAASRVERLFVPDATIRTHTWLHPEQNVVWSKMANSCDKASGVSKRVFLSRAGISNRQLRNEADVESAFANAGYTIVRPECMSPTDQISIVREATHLAGCVGSQMYLAGMQRSGGRNIVIAPRNFFLRDDVLLAKTVGHRLAVVFGSSVDFTVAGEDRGWSCDLNAVRDAIARMGADN